MSPIESAVAADGAALAGMWRIELLHPAVVHFPVALVLTAAGFWLAGLVLGRRPGCAWLHPATTALVALSAPSAWAAVATGEWADAVVGRTLFDPRVLEAHENTAKLLALLMSVAAGIALLRHWQRLSRRQRSLLSAFTGALLLCGCALLGYIGHLGASLVYQQGAAVQAPSMAGNPAAAFAREPVSPP